MEDESSCIRRKAKQTIHSEDVAPTVGWWQSPGRWGSGGLWFSWRRASVRGLRNRQFMLETPSPDKRDQTFLLRRFLQMLTFDKPDEGGCMSR